MVGFVSDESLGSVTRDDVLDMDFNFLFMKSKQNAGAVT
jgi:hypothetical protein